MLVYILIGLLVVALLAIGAFYNTFVKLKIRAEEAWADIDVQLKRRYDLIPNLLETVKGYAGHEKAVFEEVTKARSAAMGAQSVEDHAAAENMLSGALKSLFAVAEAYPDLKANQNFMELQRELTDTENKIQAARRFYNAVVRDYNTALQTFPQNIVAGFFPQFKSREFFDLDGAEGEREPVKVDFSADN